MSELCTQWYRLSCSTNEDKTDSSDIENEVIEDAHQKGNQTVELDDFSIDLNQETVRNHHNQLEYTKVIRLKRVAPTQQLHEERFFNHDFQLPTLNTTKTYDKPGFGSKVINKWLSNEKLELDDLSRRQSIAKPLARRAVWGILLGGFKLGKPIEAGWICNYLRRLAEENVTTAEEIGQCCIYLYTRDSFLHRIVNDTLRNEDESKIVTLIPYCALLSACLRQLCTDKGGSTLSTYGRLFPLPIYTSRDSNTPYYLYRGANLTAGMIE